MFATKKRFSVTGNSLSVTNRIDQGAPIAASGSREGSKEIAGALPFLFDGGSGSSNSMRMTASGPMAFNYTLTGIVPEHEELLRRYYRDCYLYDTVCGSCIDIISSFPFSDWTLTGADRKQLEKYDESLFRLNLRSLLPEVSAGYLVDGVFIGTLVFNSKDKVFIDVLLHNPDDCKIEPSPFYSFDPKVTVINNEATRRFMSMNDDYSLNIKRTFSQEFLDSLQAQAYELNPLTTLFLPRRTLPSRPPTSYLKRVLPIYLLEKQLYRGTLVEAHKRQRSLAHITAGDDNWEPTAEELESIVGMFQQADLDPLGAIIATRSSVQVQEVRQGGDFWKWNDVADTLVNYKLRALGISEAFLSGDANFSNSETALSVFIENMDAYRQFLTYKVFTNRIFPIVAYANGFFKDGKRPEKMTTMKMMYTVNNQQNLIIPKVSWHKQLEAKREENQVEMLDKLSEKGIPVPIRMWASAAKVDLDSLLFELEDDKKYKEMIAKVTGKGVEEIGQGADGGENDSGSGEQSESGDEYASMLGHLGSMLAPLNKRRKKPLLSRNFGEAGELSTKTKTGKKKWIPNQHQAQTRINRMIAMASKALADPNVQKGALERAKKKYGGIPRIIPDGMKR